MNIKKLMLFALGSAMLVSSCEPDDIVKEEPETGDYTFAASINPSASFETGDQIGVSAFSDAAYTDGIADNVLYSYKNSKFESSDPITYTEDEDVAFRAVYPYTKGQTETFNFELSVDQSAEATYREGDLMVAKLGLSDQSKPTLNFNHTLSQVIIKIEGIDGAPKLNVLTEVECDLAKGSYVGTGSVAEVTPMADGTDIYKAIVAPQTIEASTVLAVVIVGGVDYNIFLPNSMKFESGKSYTFNGRVEEDGTFIVVETDNKWDVLGEGPEEPEEPEQPEEPEDSATELISGGDFEGGESSQVTNNYSVATATISEDGAGYNGEGHAWVVSNSEVRDADYLAQFAFFLNSSLAAGDSLMVSFDVRSDNGSEITGLGMGISVDPYHIQTVVLPDGGSTIYTTTEWSKVEYNLEITDANAITEKLTFSIGNSVDNFYLDNVSVVLVSGGGTPPSGGGNDDVVDPESAGVDYVKNMGVGWNLGNALDAVGGETAWGNPKTTKEMIDFVAEKGFKTLRVPTTWHKHLSSDGQYTIVTSWMDRVEEVVNYGLDNDMYVILDIHHDEDIIIPSYDDLTESKKVVTALWKQIAERFKNYGDKLIFESLNEMRVEGSANEWNGGDDEGRDCVNQLHEASLAAIRNSGGNNATRKVMLSPYAASNSYNAMKALEIPEDDENIIVSIHSYAPYEFCMNENGTDREWGTAADKTELDNMFFQIYELFVAKGIPVIMGEWGSITENAVEERAEHAEYYAQAALDHYICPVVWDDGGNFQILNRNSVTWRYEAMADAIVKAE